MHAAWQWVSWRRWPGRILIALALLALFWTSLAWWLPGVLRPRIETAATEALGTPVQLKGLALAPWSLQVTADGLQVGPPDHPLLRLAQAQTKLSLSSVWQRAPVLQFLRLRKPEVWIERLEAGRFNFTPVLDHLSRPSPTPPSTEPARFALHNIELTDGALRYDDRVLKQTHRIDALQLAIPFISNLPSDVRTEVLPALSARIDGSALKLTGHTQPFAPDRPATLTLDWQGLNLVDWAPLATAAMPAGQAPQLSAGTLATQLKITFIDPNGPQPAQLKVQGTLTVLGLKATLPAQGLEAQWDELRLEDIDLAPLQQHYALRQVVLKGLDAQLTHTPAGKTSPAPAKPSTTAAAPAASSAASAPAHAEATPLQFKLDSFECQACTVRWRDRTTQPEAVLALQQIQVRAGPVTQDLGQPIAIDLAAQFGGPLTFKGTVQPQPLKVQADVAMNAAELPAIQPYLSPVLNLRLTAGQASLAGHLDLSDNPALALRYTGRASVAGLKTQDSVNSADVVGWRQLAFTGLDVNWRAGQLDADLGRIGLDGLQARVILHPDAHLNLADVVKRNTGDAAVSVTTPQAKGDAPPKPAPVAAPADTGPKPRIRWQQLAITQGGVHFTDNFIRPNYSARLTQLKGEVSALNSERPEPARLSISGALDDGAPLRISGTLHPLGAQLYTDIEASARGIGLDGLQARVILHPDAHLNLADVVKRNTGDAAVSVTTPQAKGDAPPKPAPVAAPADTGPKPRIRWQQLAITQGGVHFTDNFIRPNYSARLTQLKGEVSALNSERPEPARLSISGALDDGAPLRISGTLHPLGAQLYTDIEASARGIGLTRLSAYSARYAGYTIDKGTLTMTVHYKIDQGKLEAQNQIFLDQFTFGDKVDSPDATSLPVRLAVALLKNGRGEIDIRLPISGTLNDPQFSIGGLVWRAFMNLLTRVVTAPFAFLTGGDGGTPDQVHFAPGSAELDDAARQQLDKLGQSLKDRPGLKIEITGHADPGRDLPPPEPPAAASAPPPKGAKPAKADAPKAPPPDPKVVLQTLADARADRVLTHLTSQLDAERLLLTRSTIEPDAEPAGLSVVLKLR